jgi:uncharacterized membrane protein required for colicin V production
MPRNGRPLFLYALTSPAPKRIRDLPPASAAFVICVIAVSFIIAVVIGAGAGVLVAHFADQSGGFFFGVIFGLLVIVVPIFVEIFMVPIARCSTSPYFVKRSG